MRIHIEDMHCDGCVKGVTHAIRTLDDSAKIEAHLDTRDVDVDTNIARDQIDAALIKAGFTPS